MEEKKRWLVFGVFYTDSVFDLKTALSLVYLGLKNRKEIMHNQQLVKTTQMDSIYSIDEAVIAHILPLYSGEFYHIFEKKIHEIPFKSYCFFPHDSYPTQRFNYFFQNQQFHFYRLTHDLPEFPRFTPRYLTHQFSSIIESYSAKMDEDNKEKVLVSMAHINMLLRFEKENLVFNTDSTFYHLSYDGNKAYGSFGIDGYNKCYPGTVYAKSYEAKDSVIFVHFTGVTQTGSDARFVVTYNTQSHTVHTDMHEVDSIYTAYQTKVAATKKSMWQTPLLWLSK